MLKNIFVFISLFISTLALADPAPFGLELGKASYEDVIAKYPKFNEIEDWKISVDKKYFDLEGLTEDVRFSFFEDGERKLYRVVLYFDKGRFDDLLSSLSKKYKVVEKKIPYVGNRYAKFKDGESTIELESPHLSFTTILVYITDEALKSINDRIDKEEKDRKNKQDSSL